MAKHPLIIPSVKGHYFPVRSEAGQLQNIRFLLIDVKGTGAPPFRREQYMVVAPGDELELELSPGQEAGASLWFFEPIRNVLLTSARDEQKSGWKRVDILTSPVIVRVNPSLSSAPENLMYSLQISALGVKREDLPTPPTGGGNTDTMVATKP